VSLVGIRTGRVVPDILRVPPNRSANHLCRLPFVPRVNVPVEDRQRVTEDLVVDPAYPERAAATLDRLAQQREVEQELGTTRPIEIGEMVDGRIVR
jgi:hypothetical protein